MSIGRLERFLPGTLPRDPYQVSVFTGLSIAGVVSWGYGLVFLLPRSMGFGYRDLAVLEFLTGALCLIVAAAVGRPWLSTAARQEVATVVCISALLSTLSWAMHVGEVSPEQMTAESIVFMVVGSSIVRSPKSLFYFWSIATLNWLLTQYLDPLGTFITRSWALTWVVATAGAIAVYAMASTQRRLAEALRRATEALAERDLLTGLHNRRGFMRQATRMVASAKRERTSLWMGFIDVDRF